MRKAKEECYKDYLANKNAIHSKRGFAKRWGWSPTEASCFIDGISLAISMSTDVNTSVNTDVNTEIKNIYSCIENLTNEIKLLKSASVSTVVNTPVSTPKTPENKDLQSVNTGVNTFLSTEYSKPIVFNGFRVSIHPVSQGLYISLDISSFSSFYRDSTLKEKEKLKQKEKERKGGKQSVTKRYGLENFDETAKKQYNSLREKLSQLERVRESVSKQSLHTDNTAKTNKNIDFLQSGNQSVVGKNRTPVENKGLSHITDTSKMVEVVENVEVVKTDDDVLVKECLIFWNEYAAKPLGRAILHDITKTERSFLLDIVKKQSIKHEVEGVLTEFKGVRLWELICWTLGRKQDAKEHPNWYHFQSVASWDWNGAKLAREAPFVVKKTTNLIYSSLERIKEKERKERERIAKNE